MWLPLAQPFLPPQNCLSDEAEEAVRDEEEEGQLCSDRSEFFCSVPRVVQPVQHSLLDNNLVD